MGRLAAQDMIEHTDIRTALSWHLTSNHYPPVPTSMVPVCLEALAAYGEEEYDRLIELPEGVQYRGSDMAPASAIVEQHHLDAFLSSEEDEA